MFQVLKSVGQMALPYLVEGAVDIAKSTISKTLGASDKGSIKKTLGNCAEKLVDTIGNRLDVTRVQVPKREKRRSQSAKSSERRYEMDEEGEGRQDMVINDTEFDEMERSTTRPEERMVAPREFEEE